MLGSDRHLTRGFWVGGVTEIMFMFMFMETEFVFTFYRRRAYQQWANVTPTEPLRVISISLEMLSSAISLWFEWWQQDSCPRCTATYADLCPFRVPCKRLPGISSMFTPCDLIVCITCSKPWDRETSWKSFQCRQVLLSAIFFGWLAYNTCLRGWPNKSTN